MLGETFDLATLIRAGHADQGLDAVDAVDAATAVGLIEALDEPPGRYGFVHALTRQVVVDQLATSHLRLLHARIADALDRGPTNDPALVPRLAHHYLNAHVLGYHEQALRYATLAARQAARSLAYEEAAQWFERAAALPESGPADVAESLFGAADNHARAADYTRAREIYERLTHMPDPLVRLRAAMGFEEATWPPGGPTPGPPIYSPGRSRTAGSTRTTSATCAPSAPWAGRSRSPLSRPGRGPSGTGPSIWPGAAATRRRSPTPCGPASGTG